MKQVSNLISEYNGDKVPAFLSFTFIMKSLLFVCMKFPTFMDI